MSKDIIDLKTVRDGLVEKANEKVFQCKCGGQLFWLVGWMGIQCRSCNTILESLCWGHRE